MDGLSYIQGVSKQGGQQLAALPRRAVLLLNALIVCVVGVLAAVPAANAHMLNMTKVSIDVKQDAPSDVTVLIDLGQSLLTPQEYWEISKQPMSAQTKALEQTFSTLSRTLVLRADGESQTMDLQSWSLPAGSLDAVENPLTPQMATLRFTADLTGKSDLELVLDDTLQIPWPCLLRVDLPNAALPTSRLLTASWRSSKTIEFAGTSVTGTPLDASLVSGLAGWLVEATWVAVGFQHILPLGYDHILFVLGLLLVATSAKALLWQVSGFTLAHSITLALAAFGTVTVPAGIVEPLIALSIVYIGLEYLYPGKSARLRFGVVFAFGLLHGLGFASALSALSLPTENPWTALIAFNLGIELGQLTVLALAFFLARWFVRRPWYARLIAQPASVTISGIGVYWFLSRLISG